jgi:hypothetical protein
MQLGQLLTYYMKLCEDFIDFYLLGFHIDHEGLKLQAPHSAEVEKSRDTLTIDSTQSVKH